MPRQKVLVATDAAAMLVAEMAAKTPKWNQAFVIVKPARLCASELFH